MSEPVNNVLPIKSWVIDLAQHPKQADIRIFHGEAWKLECTLYQNGKLLNLLGASGAVFYWKPVGSDEGWYEKTATIDTERSVISAIFTGDDDDGSNVFRFFIKFNNAEGVTLSVNGCLRMLGSPGDNPHEIEFPVKVLDFDKIEVLNAPYFTKEEINEEFYKKGDPIEDGELTIEDDANNVSLTISATNGTVSRTVNKSSSNPVTTTWDLSKIAFVNVSQTFTQPQTFASTVTFNGVTTFNATTNAAIVNVSTVKHDTRYTDNIFNRDETWEFLKATYVNTELGGLTVTDTIPAYVRYVIGSLSYSKAETDEKYIHNTTPEGIVITVDKPFSVYDETSANALTFNPVTKTIVFTHKVFENETQTQTYTLPDSTGVLATQGYVQGYTYSKSDLNDTFTAVNLALSGKQPSLSTAQLNNIDAVPNKQDALSQTQLNNIDAVPNKLNSVSAAPAFSATTAYSKGTVVSYEGKTYRFTSAHPAGAWTGTDVEDYVLTEPDAMFKLLADGKLQLVNPDGSVVWTQNGNLTGSTYDFSAVANVLAAVRDIVTALGGTVTNFPT